MELERFYRAVGLKLTIVAGSQPMQADDRDTIHHAWASLHAMLDENGLAIDGPDKPVPDQIVDPMIDMLAATLVDQFGLTEPRRTQIRGEGMFGIGSPAERRLRKVLAVPGLDIKHNEYF